MQGKLVGVDRQDIAVVKARDDGLFAEFGLQESLAILCAQIGLAAPSSVIRMCMGYDGTLHRTSGINVKVTIAAVKTAGSEV